jgi:hypothetical protein
MGDCKEGEVCAIEVALALNAAANQVAAGIFSVTKALPGEPSAPFGFRQFSRRSQNFKKSDSYFSRVWFQFDRISTIIHFIRTDE